MVLGTIRLFVLALLLPLDSGVQDAEQDRVKLPFVASRRTADTGNAGRQHFFTLFATLQIRTLFDLVCGLGPVLIVERTIIDRIKLYSHP